MTPLRFSLFTRMWAPVMSYARSWPGPASVNSAVNHTGNLTQRVSPAGCHLILFPVRLPPLFLPYTKAGCVSDGVASVQV